MTQGDDESQTSGKEEVDEVPVPVTVGAETKKTRRPPDPENSRPPTVLNVGIDDLFPTVSLFHVSILFTSSLTAFATDKRVAREKLEFSNYRERKPMVFRYFLLALLVVLTYPNLTFSQCAINAPRTT